MTDISGERFPVFKPKPFDAKSKGRLVEHGDTWRSISDVRPVAFSTEPHILLQSVKTGYRKWWPSTHTGTIC